MAGEGEGGAASFTRERKDRRKRIQVKRLPVANRENSIKLY